MNSKHVISLFLLFFLFISLNAQDKSDYTQKINNYMHSLDGGFQYKLMPGEKICRVFFYGTKGNTLSNLNVMFDNRPMYYDKQSQSYIINGIRRTDRKLEVTVNGVYHSFNIMRLFKKYTDFYHLGSYYAQKKDFLASLYPKQYKLGDTIPVRVSYDFDGKVDLELSFKKYGENFTRKEYLATIEPDVNGVYAYDFVLTDDYISMVDNYSFYINFTLHRKNDKYGSMLAYSCVSSKSELLANTDKKEYFTDDSPAIILKLTEIDSISSTPKLNLQLKTKKVRQAADSVFIPNILWEKTLDIDVNKEYNISLPAKLFPQANADYTLNVKREDMFNPYSSEVDFYYQNMPEGLRLTIDADRKLVAEYLNPAHSISSPAVLTAYGIDEKYITKEYIPLYKENLILPASVEIPPTVAYLRVETDKVADSIQVNTDYCPIVYSKSIKNDSVRIAINSPLKNPYWYTLWKRGRKDKIVSEGFSRDSVIYINKGKSGDKYALRLMYLDGGRWWEVEVVPEADYFHVKPRLIDLMNSLPHSFSRRYTSKNPYKEELDRLMWTDLPIISDSMVHNNSFFEDNERLPIKENTSLRLTLSGAWDYIPEYIVLKEKGKSNNDNLIYRCMGRLSDLPVKDENAVYDIYVLCENNAYYHREVRVKGKTMNCYTIDPDAVLFDIDFKIREKLKAFPYRSSVRIYVVDEKDEPVIGATVILKGSTQGAVSDWNGVAKLDIPLGYTGDIEISFIGTKTQRIRYSGQPEIRVVLEDASPQILY